MQYHINKDNYKDFAVFGINRLPPRSYFIPFSSRKQADKAQLLKKRYVSDRVVCLNGEWDFCFYAVPKFLPDILDTDAVQWKKIDVPSCWQFRGYGRPFYVNMNYQFPFDPPHIPEEEPVGAVKSWYIQGCRIKFKTVTPIEEYNFVGVYRRIFSVCQTNERFILSFLGAASCVDVYLNGQFVGYHEGSHNTCEFDVTSLVREGNNELLVVVHRWCNGSYLEDQDMFRNNGIFRDVLLYRIPKNGVWDVHTEVHKQEDGRYSLIVKTELFSDNRVELLFVNGKETSCKIAEGKDISIRFDDLPIREWSAEFPILYDLYVCTADECVRLRVGFKDIRIDGRVFLWNGRKIKLRGVNHHDVSPVNGYTLTAEEIERDISLCKEYNIDTIRTSHYPPDPLFLELCDEYGVYVVLENDLETHGAYSHKFPPNFNRISNDTRWKNHYLDRIQHLFERDKNHVCIVMFSLGNESGGYRNTDAMYQYLKAKTQIPVHYEGVVHCKRKAYDVASEMYPPLERLRAVGRGKCRTKKFNKLPYFMCEYAYAASTGPGGAEEYWNEVLSHDSLLGGCVWEMCDHAVLESDGNYTYGGDHGEWEHDGVSCLNGLFLPDRTPSDSAKVIAHAYRPLRVHWLDGDKFEIFNTTSFTPGETFLLVFRNEAGEMFSVLPQVSPGAKQVLTVPFPHVAGCGGIVLITVQVYDNRTKKIVSREQMVISAYHKNSWKAIGGAESAVFVRNGELKIGDTLRTLYPNTVLYRAPIVNDYDYRKICEMQPFIDCKEKIVRCERQGNAYIVHSEIVCKGYRFLCEDAFERAEDGIIVTCRLHCVKGRGFLPRFGKVFRLDERFDRVEYFGRNGQSYADMKEHTQIEKVTCRVRDMTERNIKPQESGNRMDVRYIQFSDGKSAVIFEAKSCFEVGVKPYSDADLIKMKHLKDEKQTGTYVTIQAFQMGVGTGACGSKTRQEYRYPADRDYELSFKISIRQ